MSVGIRRKSNGTYERVAAKLRRGNNFIEPKNFDIWRNKGGQLIKFPQSQALQVNLGGVSWANVFEDRDAFMWMDTPQKPTSGQVLEGGFQYPDDARNIITPQNEDNDIFGIIPGVAYYMNPKSRRQVWYYRWKSMQIGKPLWNFNFAASGGTGGMTISACFSLKQTGNITYDHQGNCAKIFVLNGIFDKVNEPFCIFIKQESNGQIGFYFNRDRNGGTWTDSQNCLLHKVSNLNDWTDLHFTLTVERKANGQDEIKLYAFGIDKQVNAGTRFNLTTNDTSRVFMSGNWDASNIEAHNIKCKMYSLRTWNTVLTPAEVKALYDFET